MPADESSARAQLSFRFNDFLDFLAAELHLPAEQRASLAQAGASDPYKLCGLMNIPSESLARYFAAFCSFDFLPFVNPESAQLNLLTASFCKSNSVIPVKLDGKLIFAVSNPFRFEIFDVLAQKFQGQPYGFAVADPKTISFLLVDDSTTTLSSLRALRADDSFHGKPADETESPIALIADNILTTAVQHRASDIHVEPKESHVLVRFRIDGDMKEIYGLKTETGTRLLSRLKVFGNLDIAEKRKPQDGMIEAEIAGKKFKLRLATTSTPKGESMIIRLLDQSMEAPQLGSLGLTPNQAQTLTGLARRDRGLILIVGATGSGKTTTIYSLLSQIDCKAKSLITVEDPVEYKIAFANQQQVNEKAGITFESVLKSSMREDPDILYLGEVRDTFSSKAAMDFASTGHLTITTLHTSNATTAIFRLERLGVARGSIADSVVAIVAQRLLKKLCETCLEVSPPTEEEIRC